jgi:hypothetical protein
MNIRFGHQNFPENVIFTKYKKIGAGPIFEGQAGMINYQA